MNNIEENYDVWLEGFDRQKFPALAGDRESEVTIIGGGMTGIMSAYLLAKAGKKVILLEKARLGEWATDCTTAFLTQSLDTSYRDLVFILGLERARKVAKSHGEAIDLIEKIIAEEKIDCNFRRTSNRLLGRTNSEVRWLRKEAAIMRSLGLSAEFKTNNDLNIPIVGYVELANQATYHPMKFLNSLAKRAAELGAEIFEETEVVNVKREGQVKIVSTKDSKIITKDVIVATYEPLNQPIHLYFKKAMYRSYVCEFNAPKDFMPEGLYEDLHNPYHYFKVDNFDSECRIIFGGEDHREDIKIGKEKNYKALLRHARQIMPELSSLPKRYWSGPILESIDGLAYIGRDKHSGINYAFAFSGNGLTYAAIAATMFAGKSDAGDFMELYSVNRWPRVKAMLVKGKDYASILYGGAIKNFFS